MISCVGLSSHPSTFCQWAPRKCPFFGPKMIKPSQPLYMRTLWVWNTWLPQSTLKTNSLKKLQRGLATRFLTVSSNQIIDNTKCYKLDHSLSSYFKCHQCNVVWCCCLQQIGLIQLTKKIMNRSKFGDLMLSTELIWQ